MKQLHAVFTIVAALAAAAPALHAQSAADSAAIRATALDYAEGWYGGVAARMQRALHPELAKRIVRTGGNGSTLQHMTAAQLVAATGSSGGAPATARKDVRILDIFGATSSVRLEMDGWIDYMHMAKWNGRWVIINVLWELKPR
jgi:hypothetical protein